MERGESILDAIFDEDSLEDVQDVEMMDVEEGELVLLDSQSELGQPLGGDDNTVNQESVGKNRRRTKKKKKKNRSEKASSGPKVTDINRFVTNICKCLRERKTYLVYTAVGCLGVSALSDLVKEVSAIQACGGQKTADGRRFRNGGGILWNVLKSRDPNAYKEIMTRGKEFEKQFKQQITRQNSAQNKEASSERKDHALMNRTISSSSSDGLQIVPNVQKQLELSGVAGNCKSVHDRLRAPVSYDDLPGNEDPKEGLALSS